MARELVYDVRDFQVWASKHAVSGEHSFGIKVTLSGGDTPTLIFPMNMLEVLLGNLSGMLVAARSEGFAGGRKNPGFADKAGPSTWFPTYFEIEPTKGVDGDEFLVLRLQKDQRPVVEAMFHPEEAKLFARAILEAVDQMPTSVGRPLS